MTHTPTLNQMKARCLSGHVAVLNAVATGKEIEWRTAGEARGIRKCTSTLLAWGCIENGQLTPVGEQLRAAIGGSK